MGGIEGSLVRFGVVLVLVVLIGFLFHKWDTQKNDKLTNDVKEAVKEGFKEAMREVVKQKNGDENEL